MSVFGRVMNHAASNANATQPTEKFCINYS